MNRTLQIVMLLAVLVYFILLFGLLRKGRLSLRYTLLWIFSGIFMLVLAIFPQILNAFAALIGIQEPTNALFTCILFCMIIILMSLTAIVSKLSEQVKGLTQTLALLEKRLRDREEAPKV